MTLLDGLKNQFCINAESFLLGYLDNSFDFTVFRIN